MGEYAEMMLDGTCCEACGAYIGDPTGYPGYCSRECARDRGADHDLKFGKPFKSVKCRQDGCGKVFSDTVDMEKHWRAKHSGIDWQRCPVCRRKCKGLRALEQHREATGH